MARAEIDGALEDEIFRILEDTQGIDRRLFRIIARGRYNIHAIDELRHQAKSVVAGIEVLAERVA